MKMKIIPVSVAKSNAQRYRLEKEASVLRKAEEYVESTLDAAITVASMDGYSSVTVTVPCLVPIDVVFRVLESAGYTVNRGRFTNQICIHW